MAKKYTIFLLKSHLEVNINFEDEKRRKTR
jgi:hypothetical protein